MERARLEDLCAPPGVVAPDRKHLKKTLARWIDLGLFVETNDELTLARLPPRKASDQEFLTFLRRQILETFLLEANVPALDGRHPAPTDGSSDEASRSSRATDFARVTSWALLQDPFVFADKSFTQLQEMAKAQDARPPIFSGDNILSGFQEWAHFTGLGVPTPSGFLVAPTYALRERLDEVFGEHTELPFVEFLALARRAIPVLPGGAYSAVVAGQLEKPWRTFGDAELPPALSLAIMQLRHEGELYCSDREGDQTPHVTLLKRGGRTWQRFSHVRRDRRPTRAEKGKTSGPA